jgi:hypothetical protein
VDALVPEPIFASTHAITIDAPPELVWPWIAQMGAGRAGWYSWDAIDNGGAPSRTRIVPELQSVARGDIMPAVPGAKDAFVVAAVDPTRDLVLTVPDGHGGNAVGWEHLLDPLPGGRTRLIVRGRASSQWLALASTTLLTDHRRFFIERVYAALAMLPRPLLIAFAALGHRIMKARHLRGIQRRSTADSSRHAARGEEWRKALLVCGIASSLLYALMIWAIRYEGYNPQVLAARRRHVERHLARCARRRDGVPHVARDRMWSRGVWERINISVFLLWIVIVSAVLWRPGTAVGGGT